MAEPVRAAMVNATTDVEEIVTPRSLVDGTPRSLIDGSPRNLVNSPPRQQPMRVFEVMQADLLRVDCVDAIHHNFQASLFLALILRDGGLDPDLCVEEALFPLDASGKPTFKPSARWFWDKIEFTNATEIVYKDVQHVRREGDDLILRFRVVGTFVEVMELKEYPFDVQALTFSIQLNCRTTGPMPVRFAVPSNLEQSVSQQGFALINLEYAKHGELVVEATEVELAKGRCFPTLRVSVLMSRRPESILINCALPMGAFALLAIMAIICIPVSEQGDRLDVTLNLILTCAAYTKCRAHTGPALSPQHSVVYTHSLAPRVALALLTVACALCVVQVQVCHQHDDPERALPDPPRQVQQRVLRLHRSHGKRRRDTRRLRRQGKLLRRGPAHEGDH